MSWSTIGRLAGALGPVRTIATGYLSETASTATGSLLTIPNHRVSDPTVEASPASANKIAGRLHLTVAVYAATRA